MPIPSYRYGNAKLTPAQLRRWRIAMYRATQPMSELRRKAAKAASRRNSEAGWVERSDLWNRGQIEWEIKWHRNGLVGAYREPTAKDAAFQLNAHHPSVRCWHCWESYRHKVGCSYGPEQAALVSWYGDRLAACPEWFAEQSRWRQPMKTQLSKVRASSPAS